ncbi:precorrin-6x reductase CbiJ/CobK-like protein, partial [Propionibacterium acidifaciens F0233]
MDVLILGGTALARTLAGLLVEQGLDVTTSLAGRTKAPRAVPGAVRIGGFGGPDGLAAWLVENRPGCVVNAVHPFAAAMSASAAAA